MQTKSIILDDGDFLIDLAQCEAASSAPGFLIHLAHLGDGRRRGYECVGSFGLESNGTWWASVNTAYNPATDLSERRVAQGVTRLDAIAALWRSRKFAYCQIK